MRLSLLVPAAAILLVALGIRIIPQGQAALRVSLFGGVNPHTLYPGVYWICPMLEQLDRFETRDKIYDTPQKVHTREGYPVRLGVVFRYRVDPERLIYLQGVHPLDFERRYLGPLVESQVLSNAPNFAFHQLEREEYRAAVAESIAKRLLGDGIVARDLLIHRVDEELPEICEERVESAE